MLRYIPFAIIAIATCAYLFYQAYEDKKDKTVPVIPNYIAIAVSLLLYFGGCLFTKSIPDFKGLLFGFAIIFIFSFLRVYGIGDAKALFAIFVTGSFVPTADAIFQSNVNYFLVGMTYIISSLAFLPGNVIKGRKKGLPWKKVLFGKNRAAFFPYLAVGYTVTVAFMMLAIIL